jgi:hypothetical protein
MNEKILLFYKGFEFTYDSEQELNQALEEGLENMHHKAILKNITYFLNKFTTKDLDYDFREKIKEAMKFFPNEEISKFIYNRFLSAKIEINNIIKTPIKGFVYLIASENDCKIGCSQNVKSRVKRISQQAKKEYTIIDVIPTNDMYYTEAVNHLIHVPYNLHGEYFVLSDSIKLYSIR